MRRPLDDPRKAQICPCCHECYVFNIYNYIYIYRTESHFLCVATHKN